MPSLSQNTRNDEASFLILDANYRRKKGCKSIINCEHTEEKHYAKVRTSFLLTIPRGCAICAIISGVELNLLSSANIRMICIIQKVSAKLVIFLNTQRYDLSYHLYYIF